MTDFYFHLSFKSQVLNFIYFQTVILHVPHALGRRIQTAQPVLQENIPKQIQEPVMEVRTFATVIFQHACIFISHII